MLRIESNEQAAQVIREHTAAGRTLIPRGGGTKLQWSGDDRGEAVQLDARGLDRILEHNTGDFTAVLEAGVRLRDAQDVFARTDQMLAIDPPLGDGEAATIGGVLAASDSGPLRHRYGSMRDLVIGSTVVLSDGTIASSGGRVIKNVAGYDLAKLFTGSFGTLGLITRIAVRLHPRPVQTATLLAHTANADALASSANELARLPLEADCLDVTWANGAGRLLLRFAGAAAHDRAEAARKHVAELNRAEIFRDDEPLWQQQRDAQRSRGGILAKVSGRATDLPNVLRVADRFGGTVVSRAALGLSWISLPAAVDLIAIRTALAPRACTVLDGADRVAQWPEVEPGVLALMQRVKARFDPTRAFRPGAFVGGI